VDKIDVDTIINQFGATKARKIDLWFLRPCYCALCQKLLSSSVRISYIANILAIIMGSVKFEPTGYC